MKRLALGLGAFVLLIAGTAHAQYGMAGCGLGAMIFGNDQGTANQVIAATTNGTFANQTFGISSGTSNCVSGGVVKAEREQAAFAEVNFQDLKGNMAAGGGEYLATFATLLGCEDSARPAFSKMTQDKIEVIVPSTSTTPIQMLISVKQQIKASPSLAASCTDARAIARAEGKVMTLAKR
jgi:hypothetical protein